VDFQPVHAGETFVANRYYQRYTFEAVTSRPLRGATYRWDLGDGQHAEGERVEHVYLTTGRHTVTLTAKTPSGSLTRTNRVFVSRPWDRVTDRRLDGFRTHAKIVSGYDFASLEPTAAVGEAITLLERAGLREAVLRAGQAFCARARAPHELVTRVVPVYAEALVAAGQVDKAVADLRKAADMASTSSVARATVLAMAGRIALKHKHDDELAMALFQDVLKKHEAFLNVRGVRLARIGTGDVWRVRGDYAKARKAYRAAGIERPRRPGKDPFIKGDFARHVEAYIRTRQLDDAEAFLDKWAYAFPLEKLEGYWSLMAVRLHQVRRRHAEAVREARTLAEVNPRSNYAAELLWRAAESCRRLDRPDDARALLRRIAEDYPESPFAAKAAEKLKEAS
jgi:tetratricopeptide (TPR) repeat protein